MLTNQSLYNKILLLQKFDDIGGKVLKPKKFSLQPQKNKMGPFFIFLNWDFDLEISHLRKKVFILTSKCKLELCMSNGSKVLIYLSFLLKEAFLAAAATPNKHMVALYLYIYI